jgi:putative tryptophan/tyrosine transport system substrate-binding protein
LIVSNSSRLVLAFRAATAKIPILMLTASDPVAWGLVERLNRPGANITGFAADAGYEETGKRLQFLSEAAPGRRAITYLGALGNWTGPGAAVVRDAAQQTNLELRHAIVEGPVTPESVTRAMASIPDPGRTGLLVANAAEFSALRREIAANALARQLAVIGYYRDEAQAGYLLSYGPQRDDGVGRRAAAYADRILKGANPGGLPVQLPTTFEFIINLKTARALGLTISERLLVFATEVIE